MTTSKINPLPLVQLEWDKAAELVAAAQKIAVVTHLQPDGDAIGSMMGLTMALRSQGKHVTPYVEGGLPERFAFVPNSADIQSALQNPCQIWSSAPIPAIRNVWEGSARRCWR